MKNIIYSITLIIISIVIWRLLYIAQFLEYDINYGVLINAFLISVISFFILIFIRRNWKDFITTNKWITIAFLLFCSPLSVVIVIFNYSLFFGSNLKV